MKSLNKVELIGFVGKDPEIKTIGDSTVANFNLATSYTYKQNNEVVEKTDWHKIQAWGKLAEIVEKYVKKGSRIYIEGSIHTREYEKDGEKKYITEIKMSNLIMLDNKEKAGSNNESSNNDPIPDDLPF
jgi:single-strand DNA-binding protein